MSPGPRRLGISVKGYTTWCGVPRLCAVATFSNFCLDLLGVSEDRSICLDVQDSISLLVVSQMDRGGMCSIHLFMSSILF
jgi:hypothetical protein